MACWRVTRFFVEGTQQSQAREVTGVRLLELLHEEREGLLGAVDIRDRLVDLGADGGSRTGHGERLVERCEGLCVLVLLREGAPEVLQGRRKRTVVAGRCRHELSQPRFGALVFAAREKVSAKLTLHEKTSGLLLHELLVETLRRLPVLGVERERDEGVERL